MNKEKIEFRDILVWLLKLMALIHIFYVYRGLLCNWECMNLSEYFELWIACIFMLGLYYVPFTFGARLKYFQEATQQDVAPANEIVLNGLGKKGVRLILNSIVYCSADSNYVDIYSITDGKLQKNIIRASLTQIDTQLSIYPQFKRVHRKYIFNTRYGKITKGVRSIDIEVSDVQLSLPVSAKYKKNLLDLS